MPCLDQKWSLDSLAGFFREGVKKPSEQAVGIEWEKIGVRRDSGRAIGYSGPAGVEAILRALTERYGWEAQLQNGRPIALQKKRGSITLEPGGQIELSGQTWAHLSGNEIEIRRHLAEIHAVSGPLGIAWLGIGAQPVSVASEIEWVPKERYAVMRGLLAGRGEQTFAMMKETASIQVSLDYTSESDAMEKFRLALRLGPYLTALFANSPVEGGRKSPYLSRRNFIWSRTAPERSGVIDAVLREDSTFEDYADYALDVPMLFVVRDGRWLAVKDRTFRQFLKEGFEGLEALPEDWELHLTGIFTEARLKHFLEIRTIDCQQTAVGLAAAAFLKGIFYDDAARLAARRLTGRLSAAAIREGFAAARVDGLRAVIAGAPARETASELVRAAREGLARSAAERGGPDETPYLEPVEAIVSSGRTPAEKLLDCFSGPDPLPRLIQCAEI